MSESPTHDEQMASEGIASRVRNAANVNKIKLWEDPYYSADSGPCEGKLLELSMQLCATLDLEEMSVFEALVTLQQNALERLEARAHYKEDNMIVIKFRLTKNLQKKDEKTGKMTSTLQTEVNAEAMGKDLLEHAAGLLDVEPASLKAIFSGKVLTEDGLLTSQGVKPGALIMLAKIDHKDESLVRASEQRDYLEGVKEDAKLLGKGTGETADMGLEIANQNGERLALPADEQQSLIMAMSLDEKGRACVKNGDFELGLVMMLEASHEYKNCRSELLERSDNYAVLNIEISWCYLKLNNLSQLTDAEERLDDSSRILRKIHGNNLERVVSVKGNAANERVLYMRLHMLQGIVAFHQGNKDVAQYRLGQAKEELGKLQVDEDDLEEVCASGYSRKEAMLGLRASEGSVSGAVRHAQNLREDRQRVMEANEKRRKLGKTLNGNWVNLGKVKSLQSMGFHEDMIVMALRNSDNDMNEAIDMIQNRPDMLEMAMATEAATQSRSELSSSNDDGEAGEAGPSSLARAAKRAAKDEDKKAYKEAYKRMKEDLGENGEGDDYLNCTLEEEEEVLKKYLEYVSKT